MDIKQAAVIGGGTMGNGICHIFAMHGIPVNLAEMNQELADNALNTIDNNLERMVKKEKIDAEQKVQTLENISTFTNTIEAVKDVDLVIEAVPERAQDEILKSIKQLLKKRFWQPIPHRYPLPNWHQRPHVPGSLSGCTSSILCQ